MTEVTIDVADASAFAANRKPAGRALPVMNQQPGRAARASPRRRPCAIRISARIIAVSSGKGGVGKSTVA